MNKHLHYDTILAFAEGKIIQEKDWEGNWVDNPNPRFHVTSEYRVKPAQDIERKFSVSLDYESCFINSTRYLPNIKLVFDGETKKLKSAEVLEYV